MYSYQLNDLPRQNNQLGNMSDGAVKLIEAF